ncbi:DUF3467 domain-containing protein [Chloroflexota bacterium]
MAEQGKPMEIKIKIPDDIMGGVYSNNVIIAHTKEEFIMTFTMVTPPHGIATARVIMSPGNAKRFANALQDNIKKYETNIAKIEPSGEPKGKFDFHPN